MEYTSVDRVLSNLSRELRNTDLNESDVIEWTGQALEHLKVYEHYDQTVAFLEVSNYKAELPLGLHLVLQIAKNNKYSGKSSEAICLPDEVIAKVEKETQKPVPLDCDGKPICDYEVSYYRPFFDLQYEYLDWCNCNTYSREYSPIRLANHTFFNNMVCKEKCYNQVYNGSCENEYTIKGINEKAFKFSFEKGLVAVSYLATPLDKETGYPLIPDEINILTAITYYVKWKMAENMQWNKTEGAQALALDSERKWQRYCRQAKNKAKMPKTIDDYQNLLESTHQLIPKMKRYYNFFGNLGRMEHRKFNDPDNRINN